MSNKFIISEKSPITTFLRDLRILLILTLPQMKHIVEFIASASQGYFDGKVVDIEKLSPTHRTCIGKFLSKSTWDEDLLLKVMQKYALKRMWAYSIATGKPIYMIVDDTISKKTKPSSKAKRPIEKCKFHYSHLEGKQVYGHQVVGIILKCGDLVLPYSVTLYEKECMSKIEMTINAILSLPKAPNKGYVMADSWYSCKKIIVASLSKGFHYIGALKTNRVIYPENSRLSMQVKGYGKTLKKEDVNLVKVDDSSYWIYRYEGKLNGIEKAVVLLSWPEDALFTEGALKVFICTEMDPDTQSILIHYSKRWPIEIFFRQNKMELGLDRYQIRSAKAIKRFWILTMLTYFYCVTGTSESFCPFGKGLKLANNEVNRNIYTWIYEQSEAGVPINQVFEALKVA